MTLEQLLECSADELEKMSYEELAKHFEPYLKITRPELAKKPEKSIKRSGSTSMKTVVNSEKAKKFTQANEIMKALGLNVRV